MSKRKKLEQELADARLEHLRITSLLHQSWRERHKYVGVRFPCDEDALPTPRVELRTVKDTQPNPPFLPLLRASLVLVWHDDETGQHVRSTLKIREFDGEPELLSQDRVDELLDETEALARRLRVPCFAVNIEGQIREMKMGAEGATPPVAPPAAPAPAPKTVRLRLVLEDWVNKETGLSLLGSDFGRSLEETCIEVDADLVLKGLVGSEAELEVLKSLQDASTAGAEPLFTLRAPEIMG